MKIVPGRHAVTAALVLAALLVAAVVEPRAAWPAAAADVVLVAAIVLAGRRLRALPLDVRRVEGGRGQLGRPQDVVFRVVNRSGRDVVVRLRQPWPPGLDAAADTADVRVNAGESVDAALRVTPRVRGGIDLPPAAYEVRLPHADLARVRGRTDAGRLRVFPSLAGLTAFEALRRHHASDLAGVHRHRALGAGRDFDQIRDYVPDDDFREINWKATARSGRPVTNVYKAERSQDVIVCLDCGRMMGDVTAGGTALDHAIDAAIMVAHLAHRGGDRVGLALFRDTLTRFQKPAGGMSAVNRLIERLVDARAEPVFPSYAALAAGLRQNQTRRAFVFLFTDLNDPQLASNLQDVLPLISTRHAATVVSLRDPLVERFAAGPADGTRGVYDVLAAGHIHQERVTRVRELQKLGAQVVEADAGSLTTRAVNAFLSVRARQVV